MEKNSKPFGPKFFFFPFDGMTMRVYSQKTGKYYMSDDISNIVHLSQNETIKGVCMTLPEIMDIFPVQDGQKKHRPVIAQTVTNHYPLKERDGYGVHNGTIRIDLDIDSEHSQFIKQNNLTKEDHDLIYNSITYNCSTYLANNFLYMEHSSSGTGIHMFFWYEIPDKSEENFLAAAEYCKNKFQEIMCNALPQFANIFIDDEIFDIIYKKLFQKTYLTGKDYYINYNATGNINPVEFEKYKVRAEEKVKQSIERRNNYMSNSHDIVLSSNLQFRKVYHHTDRFKHATALKAATKSKTEWENEMDKLCSRYLLYDNYTYSDFRNAFRYEDLDPSSVPATLLETIGYKIDKSHWKKELFPNQYLGDVLPEILSEVENGINLLIAPTGCGKTVSWINYHKQIQARLSDRLESLFDIESPSQKAILIVEPLNSITRTKYGPDTEIIIEKKKFPKKITDSKLYVTNYNHLLLKKGDEYTTNPDFKEIIKSFQFIVIDESHILCKDMFRANVLLPFIKTLNEINEIPVILQTATPMYEEKLFNIKKTFDVIKKSDKEIKYIFRRVTDPKFDIMQLQCLIRYYIQNTKKKVYIYWNNAELQKLLGLNILFDRMAFYHKKLEKEDPEKNSAAKSMEFINKNHILGDEYDALASSVYFGVGNDLNDEGDTAVIIIGNNSWQEDIQAIGRWRKSKNIEVCQILLPEEADLILDFSNPVPDFDMLYQKEKAKNEQILYDKRTRSYSVLINKKEYHLKSREDLHCYTVMNIMSDIESNLNYKITQFEKLGFRVKKDLNKDLLVNEEWEEDSQNYKNSVKKVRNSAFQKILDNSISRDEIKKDNKLVQFESLMKMMKKAGFSKEDLLILTKTNTWPAIKLILSFCDRFTANKMDYPELFSILLVCDKINSVLTKSDDFKQNKEILNETILEDENYSINRMQYYIACGYAIFCKYHNTGLCDTKIAYNYFKQYYNAVIMISDLLLPVKTDFDCGDYKTIYNKNKEKYFHTIFDSADGIKTYDTFQGSENSMFMMGDLIMGNEPDIIKTDSDFINYIESGETDFQYYLIQCYKYFRVGPPEKSVEINGVVYANRMKAAEILGVNEKTIRRYIKAGKGRYIN